MKIIRLIRSALKTFKGYSVCVITLKETITIKHRFLREPEMNVVKNHDILKGEVFSAIYIDEAVLE